MWILRSPQHEYFMNQPNANTNIKYLHLLDWNLYSLIDSSLLSVFLEQLAGPGWPKFFAPKKFLTLEIFNPKNLSSLELFLNP